MKMNLRQLFMLTLALMVGLSAMASAPSGYYDGAKNKSNQALMTALHKIIKGHTKRSYQQDLWNDFKTTDCNGTTIIDRYSTTQYTWSSDQCGNYSEVGDCYNREHSIPNSWWGGSSSDTAYSDLHHIFPVDGWVNGQRGNYPFGDCANGTAKGTGKLGTCTFSGYTGTVFEVADEYKGDFARVYFYFATRYMMRMSSYTSGTGSVVFTSSSYLGLTTWAINQLLDWHRGDPVSTLETNRNDAVYGLQRNRNPFVDNPELVEYIWGNMMGNVWTGDGSSTTTPTLTAPTSGSTVNVGTNTGSGVTKSITVKGSDLTKALTVSVSGTGFSVSPTSISAANANSGSTVTVTYNGTATSATGTLTITSSEVSCTVNLTASYSSGGSGDPTGNETIETWEGCTGYGTYTDKSVQGAAFTWYFSNAGLFAQPNDHWNDALGCRFGKNADSYIMMSEDVTSGASKITFYAANYGSDATPTILLQYSTDSGSNWTTAATVSPTSTWQQYSYDLNLTGNVRFKFQQTAGSRVNIDDIAITSNSGSVVTNPQIIAPADGSTVNVGTIAATGTSVSKSITVKGSDLTKALTVSVTGTGFSVSPTSISAANANNGTTVTVTYTSSTAGSATGTLTISSSEASVTVNLTADKTPMPSISITSLIAMQAEQDGASTIVQGTVSADDNDENITLTVEGNFQLSLNRIQWSKSLTLDPTGEVFYVRMADTGTAGEYYGVINASTSMTSAYADVQGTVNAKVVSLGDVNMDGSIGVADVTSLLNYILTGNESPFDTNAADVDQNGEIAINDVTGLINYLLTGEWPSTMSVNQWDAVPVSGGIEVMNPHGDRLEIFNFDGDIVMAFTAAGNAIVEMPAGIYVVTSDTASRKVVVK